MISNLPNILSFLRIAFVGVFIYFFIQNMLMWALFIFVLAAFTDFLDGFIARKYNLITDLGKFLDPLADKLMLITALICLYSRNMLPFWVLVIVIAKEIIMITVGIFFYSKNFIIYSKIFGKLATFFFNIAVLLTFFKDKLYPLNEIVLFIAVALAILAMIQYGKDFVLKYNKSVKVK